MTEHAAILSRPDLATEQAEATAREASNLVRPEDRSVIDRFLDLAATTNEHLSRPEIFRMQTASAFSGVVQMRLWTDVPDHVLHGWTD